ncbi:MAG: ribonuclease HI [Bifidobacteriaceae bacterium]|jgi:ribonuclease HI|nr:ribonuclease HI [Bifidobacteriaceae bacterium]
MDDEITVVSTDGSCLDATNGPTGWAWVNHNLNRMSGGHKFGTNQVGELCAVLEALRSHHDDLKLVIETDSEYAIHSSTDWLENWKSKSRPWTNAEGKVIANLPIIQAIDYELSHRPGQVAFRWIKGHSGNEFNEIADKMAQNAARSWQQNKVGTGKLPDEAYKVNSVRFGGETDPAFSYQTLF